MMTDIEEAVLLRHELAQLREQNPGKIWLMVSTDECEDLAADVVPLTVRAMARMACEDLDTVSRKNAKRPRRQHRCAPPQEGPPRP